MIKRFVLPWMIVVFFAITAQVQAQEVFLYGSTNQTTTGCANGVCRTPVRNTVAAATRVVAAPVGVLQKIRSSTRSCGSSVKSCGAVASCGTVQSSCGTSVLPSAPAPVPVEVPCPACSACESAASVSYSATDSSAYSRALASAQYRAANGIKGHVRGELLQGDALRRAGRSSSGVGFSTSNPNPRTCLGVPGQTSATCAVVRGRDGWYSTCIR